MALGKATRVGERAGRASAGFGFSWVVNPKTEPVITDSHSIPKALSRGLLTVPGDALVQEISYQGCILPGPGTH
jgi:hypothetical protein